jgi:hypothetical protein
MGDDLYSWAVFLDGRPAYTGLSRREVPYYKGLVQDIIDKKQPPSQTKV